MIARIVLLLLLSPAAALADVRVLFIGNSLTYYNEMPWMLNQLAASRGIHLKAEFEGVGGADLRQQWNRARTLQRLREGHWDWVVLQDQSSAPFYEPDELPEYARKFDAEIRAHGAKTMLFLTWAHLRSPETQGRITRLYERTGATLHVAVAPVGIVWSQLRPRMQLFDGSEMHPNVTGTYLIACVFFALLTGQSPVGLPHRFDVHYGIPEAYRQSLEHDRIDAVNAEEIQRAAWEAVAQARKPAPR